MEGKEQARGCPSLLTCGKHWMVNQLEFQAVRTPFTRTTPSLTSMYAYSYPKRKYPSLLLCLAQP
jgi:hypothetical protein